MGSNASLGLKINLLVKTSSLALVLSKEIQIITTSIIGIAKNFGKVKKQTIKFV